MVRIDGTWNPVLLALAATVGTYLLTAIGTLPVLFFRSAPRRRDGRRILLIAARAGHRVRRRGRGGDRAPCPVLLMAAMTLHNCPEGLAVGVSFGSGELGAATALAIGISLQNIPEGDWQSRCRCGAAG